MKEACRQCLCQSLYKCLTPVGHKCSGRPRVNDTLTRVTVYESCYHDLTAKRPKMYTSESTTVEEMSLGAAPIECSLVMSISEKGDRINYG